MNSRTLEGLRYLNRLLEWKGTHDFTLDKIMRVLSHFGDPQDRVNSVHVAGTNGKGSVSCAVASILGSTGARVGLNISPHLIKPNERIVIDGRAVDDDFLAHYALELKRICEKLNITLSMHEGMTAIAFIGFAEHALDWMVMEVGLGGRLDSSNVMRAPKACCIVTIGLDHEHVLGGTLERIAAEKAGIIKKEVPLVTGPIADAPLEVITAMAVERGAPHRRYGVDFEGNRDSRGLPHFRSVPNESFSFQPALKGEHQIANMAVAMEVARVLGIDSDACRRGVAGMYWPGRLETVRLGKRRVYLDCAHNEPGVEALASFLEAERLSNLDVAFGALDTKNWKIMLSKLMPYVASWSILSPHSERAVPCGEIADYLSCNGIRSMIIGHDYERFVAEMERGDPTRAVLVTGSMYMVGGLLELLREADLTFWKRS